MGENAREKSKHPEFKNNVSPPNGRRLQTVRWNKRWDRITRSVAEQRNPEQSMPADITLLLSDLSKLNFARIAPASDNEAAVAVCRADVSRQYLVFRR